MKEQKLLMFIYLCQICSLSGNFSSRFAFSMGFPAWHFLGMRPRGIANKLKSENKIWSILLLLPLEFAQRQRHYRKTVFHCYLFFSRSLLFFIHAHHDAVLFSVSRLPVFVLCATFSILPRSMINIRTEKYKIFSSEWMHQRKLLLWKRKTVKEKRVYRFKTLAGETNESENKNRTKHFFARTKPNGEKKARVSDLCDSEIWR